jgi:hypothetical protein
VSGQALEVQVVVASCELSVLAKDACSRNSTTPSKSPSASCELLHLFRRQHGVVPDSSQTPRWRREPGSDGECGVQYSMTPTCYLWIHSQKTPDTLLTSHLMSAVSRSSQGYRSPQSASPVPPFPRGQADDSAARKARHRSKASYRLRSKSNRNQRTWDRSSTTTIWIWRDLSL